MPKKKSTRPASADQETGAADPSLVTGSGETSIEKDLDELTSELSSEPTEESASPQTEPEPAPAKKPEPTPDPSADSSPEPTEGAPKRAKISPIEMAALSLIGLVIVGFTIFLFTIPDDDLPNSDDQARASDKVPSDAQGDLLILNSIEAYWRPLSAADRTDKSSQLLPEITLKVTQKNPSAASFLKIYFIDPQGEISGDVRTARVEGGKLVDTGRGENVTGSDQVSVYGSKGLKDKNAFLAYRYSGEKSWAVQVFEGEDYSAGPWHTLAFFEIPDEIRGEPASE